MNRRCFSREVFTALAMAALVAGCAGSPIKRVDLPAAAATTAAAPSDSATSEALRLLEDDTLDADATVEKIEALARNHPNSAGVWETLGRARERADLDDEAVKALRKAVELDDSRPIAWMWLGVLLKRGGRDLAGSEDALRRALERGAPRARTLNELGVTLALQGKTGEALGVWDQAIVEDSQWGVLYANAIKASLSFKRADLAKSYYEHALSAQKPEPNLFLQWGEYLLGKKQIADAVAVYQTGVERLPASAELAHYHAQALREAGRDADSRAEFERAAALDPDGPRGRIAVWSRRVLFMMDHPDAEKEFRACVDEYFAATRSGDLSDGKTRKRLDALLPRLGALVDQYPDYWNAWEALAWTQRRTGQHEKALASLEKVLDLHPGEPNAWLELGLLLRETGNVKEGYADMLQAESIAPNDPTIQMNLALTETDLGDYEAATTRIDRIERRLGEQSVAMLRQYLDDRRSGRVRPNAPLPQVPVGPPKE